MQQKALNPTHAIVEVHSRPYTVTKSDVIVVPRMKLELGDLIVLDRIREIGLSDGSVVQGNPYVQIGLECCLMEHIEGKDITRRHWKRSGDDKYVTNRESYSLLRVRDFVHNT
jgi:ribosomal protein L21